MYQLVKYKKSKGTEFANYEFKTFEDFKALAPSLLMPLVGRYTVNIVTEDIHGIQEFIKDEKLYSHLIVNIYTTDAVIDYITMRDTTVVLKDTVKDFDIFKELISQKNIYFDKGVIHTLYNSIEHSYKEMNRVLDLIVQEYGQHVKVTEHMIAQFVIINKVVYPRQVLIDYLWLGRWRRNRLSKCVQTMGNDVVIGAMVKNIKSLLEEKAVYLKTGKGSNLIKLINTDRLMVMYRVFVVERGGLNDVFLLLNLYERGLTVNDIVNGETY